MERYDQQTYIVSHNAFANSHQGYWYANQKLTILEQLELGIRAFMLDLYWDKKDIMLYHGGSRANFWIQPFSKPVKFVTILEQFYDFLLKNPLEIVTLFLENYVTKDQLDNTIDKTLYNHIIYKPINIQAQDNWPTLMTLRNNNTRLIIFNDYSETRYAFNARKLIRQNNFSTIEEPQVLQDRISIPSAKLYLFNYFPEKGKILGLIPCDDYKKINNEKLRNILKKLDRKPTFIALNFIDKFNRLVL